MDLDGAKKQRGALFHPVERCADGVGDVRVVSQVAVDEPAAVTDQPLQAVRAHRDPEILGGDIFQLMGLVDDRGGAGRDHLAVGGLAHRRVGAEQVMVYDDQIRLGRALTHAGHKAFLVLGAVGADAVLRAGRDLTPEGEVVGQVFDLRAVAGLGLPGPFGDVLDIPLVGGGAEEGVIRPVGVEPVETEVVSPALHVGGGEVHPQRLA